MQLHKKDLDWAASQGIISSEQAESLWTALESRAADSSDATGDTPAFNVSSVAYFLGALIVIGAMGWLMSSAWESFGGGGILLLAVFYALLFAFAGHNLWFKEGRRIPGGLLITMAVCMTPLAIYGFERMLGWWPQGDPGKYRDYYIWVKGSWIFIEVGTVAAGMTAIWFVRFPFLTAPIAFSLWFMSMDLTPLIVVKILGQRDFTWDERLWVSLLFGLMIIAVAYLIDNRTPEDFSFWGYFFGACAFWGGLSLMKSGSEWGKFSYCLINVGMIFLAVFLDRRIFVVFGALGLNGYLAYLSYRVFKDSLLFPFALVAIGIFIIFTGVQYQRNQRRIEAAILALIPERLHQMRPANRNLERDR